MCIRDRLYNDLKLTEKYFGGVLPFEVLLQYRKDNSTRNKDILDPEVLEHLQNVEELLKKELKSSRFFSISTFLKSVKRIRGDEDNNSYDKNFINQILDTRGDEQLRLINKDRNV